MKVGDSEGGGVNEGRRKLLGNLYVQRRAAKAFSCCSSWIRLPGCHKIAVPISQSPQCS